MDLKQKLSRLTSAGPGSRPPRPPAPDEPPPPPLAAAVRTDGERLARVERLRGMLSKLIAEDRRKMRERAPAPSAPVALPGSLEQTPYGPLHRVESWLEPAHCHGKVPIARALEVSAETIAKLALDGALGAIDPRRMLFVDTETTGLAGGTGTIPFLIGIAFFEDQSLCIEQLVLRAPGEEAPMLRRLAERLASASCLVTFNGKSYDWPLLRNRFVLNCVAVTPPPAHLDLLHCARRIWKRRLGQVRLVHLEAEVLGMRREHDIDGAEIPQRFWDFVRGAGGSVLAPVIEHNANDLVALAAILVKLADLYEVLRPEHDPADHLGVARVAVRADDHERARLYAEAAAGGGGPADVTVDALWLAAELARKREDDTARIAHLSRALEEEVDEERRARTHLALSKLYEHRVKDYALALEHARCTAAAEGRAARDHRVARIEAKLAKSRRQGGLDLS